MTQRKPSEKIGLIGHPVAHSLSPLIHNEFLRLAQVEGVEYGLWDVAPVNLPAFLQELAEDESFIGANVTVPHKIEAFAWLAKNAKIRRGAPEALGAINTIYKEDNSHTLWGTNTDVVGLDVDIEIAAYASKRFLPQKVVILGNGGAARAAHFVYADKSEVVCLYRKDKTNWQKRAELLRDCDLLINATSGGMVGAEPLDIDISGLKKGALVYDIVYNPLITPLLAQARGLGYRTKDGLDMLIYQAGASFGYWGQRLGAQGFQLEKEKPRIRALCEEALAKK